MGYLTAMTIEHVELRHAQAEKAILRGCLITEYVHLAQTGIRHSHCQAQLLRLGCTSLGAHVT